jgi:nucleotide-binding universal stress UspA family protein
MGSSRDKGMFTHLLVPLDGSPLSETAFPAAAYLAEKLGARVTLLHVIEQHAPEEIHGQRHLTNREEAEAYLEEVAGRAFPSTIRVECQVSGAESKGVARSLQEYAAAKAVDLIVMCRHGRSGLRRLLMGSNAQQVIRFGGIPVLQICPAESGAVPPFQCRRILVPSDGGSAHERGLHVAAELAGACHAELCLLRVIPTLQTLSGERAAAAMLMPGAAAALLDINSTKAEEYLMDKKVLLQDRGLLVSIELQRGDPAEVIMQVAQNKGMDLIVVGTHRRGGTDAFWARSIAPKISNRSGIPILLIPLPTPRCATFESEEDA